LLIYESTKRGFLDSVLSDRIADEIIKNTYRTLLTRGMKGCYVFCTDISLNEYIKRRLFRNKEVEYMSGT